MHSSNHAEARQKYGLAAVALGLACALVAACGDDGTEMLSACPGGRIESDRMGILRCAKPLEDDEPKAGTGTGSAGKPATANAGQSSTQAGAAAGNSSMSSMTNWYCQQVQNACSCVSGPVASDTCSSPRPTCCVDVKNTAVATRTCICYPEDSAECAGVKMDSEMYAPIAACPPK